jgi:S1-C subfamily serine protease
MNIFPKYLVHGLVAAIVGSFAGLQTASADSVAERAFADATHYTVRISASTDYSFLESDKGGWDGAGFLVDRERRWVLTNAHVAGYVSAKILVAFKGHARVPATAKFVDNFVDVAILELPPGSIPQEAREARLACGSTPAVGSDLGAFGHPLGYPFTATRGIMAGISHAKGYPQLQTDAPISPGNSGGPLIDLASGDVVGINTASLGERRAQNMNFAVIARDACQILRLLRDDKPATIPKIATTFAVDEENVETLTVAADPQFEDGLGLRAGDTVQSIVGSDAKFESAAEFVLALRGRSGKTPLTVERAGKVTTIEARLTPSLQFVGRRGLLLSGAVFAPQFLYEVSNPDEAGRLVVHQVEPGSTADLHELHFGSQVMTVDGQRIQTLSQLEAIARRAMAAKRDLRLILRTVDSDGAPTETYWVRDLPIDEVDWYPK